MKDHESPEFPSPEEGQRRIDEWFANLPADVERIAGELDSLCQQFNSFQLIANITHHNHIRNVDQPYSDYNEGRMAVIPELAALLLIRQPYQKGCTVDHGVFLETIEKVNELLGQYLLRSDALKNATMLPRPHGEETTLEKVTNKLNRDETFVRNPGFPDHHYEIAAGLFEPLQDEIKKAFGFSVSDSIVIRKNLTGLINSKLQEALKAADREADLARQAVVTYRHTGRIIPDSGIPDEQFPELQVFSSKKLKKLLIYHFRISVFYELQHIYALTSSEIADRCQLDAEIAERFLHTFSCSFPTQVEDGELVGANTLLKTKPVLRHDGRYLIPSYAMLTWCVEPEIENFIKRSAKLSARYKDIKHDYLLRKGMQLMKQLLPGAIFFPENLYYGPEGDICETDGLIAYHDILFVIEAKGHRISNKAKGGNFQRTDNHLKEMVGDAVMQGKRTINYIRSAPSVIFKTKKKQAVTITGSHYREIITISLTLEPIGNLTPLMKVANDLNYFTEKEFPWVVSIYDLIVFADFIELPIQFIHYLERRKQFLAVHNTYVFEEIDLLAYYLSNLLYIEPTLKQAEEQQISWISFDNNTDEINDFYMHKYGHTERPVQKKQSCISKELRDILGALEVSDLLQKTAIMLELLAIPGSSMKKLTDQIKKVRQQYAADGEIHDGSLGTSRAAGNIGITYMAGPDREGVEELLMSYCSTKAASLQARLWIGLGDVNPEDDDYNFECAFFMQAP